MHKYKSRQQQLEHLAKLWLADCNDITTNADPLNSSELNTTILRQRFIEKKTIREISESSQLSISKTRDLIIQGIYSLRKKYDPQHFENNRQFLLRKHTLGANY